MKRPTKPASTAAKVLAPSELQQVQGGNVLKTRHETTKNVIAPDGTQHCRPD